MQFLHYKIGNCFIILLNLGGKGSIILLHLDGKSSIILLHFGGKNSIILLHLDCKLKEMVPQFGSNCETLPLRC